MEGLSEIGINRKRMSTGCLELRQVQPHAARLYYETCSSVEVCERKGSRAVPHFTCWTGRASQCSPWKDRRHRFWNGSAHFLVIPTFTHFFLV